MNVFDAARVEVDGRVLVEASAGTGKTYAITVLVLRALLEERVPIEGVLVVTFTEAATNELRARVRSRIAAALATVEAGEDALASVARTEPGVGEVLRRAVDAEGQPRVRRRLRLALERIDEAPISTIHGFCHRALRECAFDTGARLDAEATGDLSDLRAEMIADLWVTRLADADPALVRSLARAKVSPSSLQKLVGHVLRTPDLRIRPERSAPDPLAPEVLADAWRSLGEVWDADAIQRAVAAAKLGSLFRADSMRRWTMAIAAALELAAPDDPTRLHLDRFSARAFETNPDAPKAFAAHPTFVAVDRVLDAFERATRAEQQRVIEFKRGFLEAAVKEWPSRKERLGVTGFDDLLTDLDRALRADAGATLADRIRRRYPIALVDEFQDTDRVQWSIFERVWGAGKLVLIGDPKQAIYAFRGADVFTYLRASKTVAAERRHTMTTNRRSDPALVRAVHAIFARRSRPMFLADIDYPTVEARPDATDAFRGTPLLGEAPIRVLHVPVPLAPAAAAPTKAKKKSNPEAWNKGRLCEAAVQLAVAEVRALLDGARLGDAPVEPADIAVLTRSNEQGFLVHDALVEAGIPAVVLGDRDVFRSTDADDLGLLLAAVHEPTSVDRVRAALVTPLCGLDAAELLALEERPDEWEEWLRRFRSLADVWEQRGVMPMMRAFAEAVALPERLLARPDGERRMTNVFHLAELVHRAERDQHLGPRALLDWFKARRTDADDRASDSQLRLESDARSVRVVTVHRSKGLEYGIVVAPFLWSYTEPSHTGPSAFLVYREDDAPCLEILGGDEDKDRPSMRAVRRERLAEELRLLYVALTRARHRISIVWGLTPSISGTGLAYLIHGDEHADASDDPLDAQTRIAAIDDDAVRADLQALAAESGGGIEVVEAVLQPVAPLARHGLGSLVLRERPAPSELPRGWRLASFSQLASNSSRIAPQDDKEFDEGVATMLSSSLSVGRREIRLAEFPRGVNAGNFFHDLLEHVDFTRIDDESVPERIAAALHRHGFEDRWTAPVHGALQDLVQTPLDASGLRLCDIAPAARLNELEFHLPVASRLGGGGSALSSARLAQAFEAHPSAALHPDYHRRVRRLPFVPVEGFLKGYVDLVFRHDERWYVVDYKTNHLGTELRDYARDRLREPMAAGHYYLQYHLYVVALHRWLSRRIADYSYERHFGGVLYLFLKGMRPDAGADHGVFFERPPVERIDALARAMDGREP